MFVHFSLLFFFINSLSPFTIGDNLEKKVKIMADCLISSVQKIGNCIWPFLKPHVDYWWFFDNNIQDLRERTEELQQRKCYIVEQKRGLVFPTEIHRLEKWENESTDKLRKAQKILLPHDNIPKPGNLISRYSVGKKAKKTAEEIAKLINEGEFNTTANPAPQPAMEYPCYGPIVDIESRKSIEKGIIDSLNNSSVDMIGICGMGGVGKTTMARRIEKLVKEKNIFDEVVWVTVSQTIDLPKIQNEIAHSLKLKFDESNRANQLRKRLMDAKRKIIIFDDVWESLNYKELGFPIECNFERCKVLLTSRSKDTCKTITNKVVFDLKILGDEEAWTLFKEKAGTWDEDLDLHPLARDVAKECKGLPIALVTLGIALQGVTNVHKWKHSLSILRQSNRTDFPQVLKNVYKPLKLSYDYLENDRERDLFLMCCLFPEDYDIPIEQLTWYRMGLQLFGDITNIEEPNFTNIEEARNQTHTLVEELKSRSLLIAGDDMLHVKMHDLVRDVAIHIGSTKNYGFLKSLHRSSIENLSDVNCNWMSVDISNEQMKVPVLSRFPKLRLLMLSSNLSSNQFSDISFKGIKDLNVLSLQNISIRSLPSTLGLLDNLQTLRLFDCKVENISVIAKLTSLKILSCCKCENITELPAEIGRLKDLRLLELNGCRKLLRIPFGIISSLSVLEELKIYKSFSKWETGGERRNASLTELEGLRNLTCLEIHISDCTLSAQEMRLFQKLVRYRIRIGDKGYYNYEEGSDCEKVMNLKLAGAVGNWIKLLARNAEYLSLEGDGSDNINLAKMEHLRNLELHQCSTVKKLVESSYLNQNDSLCNLKSIIIRECCNLKSLLSVWAARRCRLQLEVLRIADCESMEQVFWIEGTDVNTDGCIEFPKLKELTLHNLPNLTAFCQGLENIIINFPNLTQLVISGLPKLKRLLSPPNSEILENTCFHLFCNPNPKEVSLGNLKYIIIGRCCNLRCLFSVSAAGRYLLQLEDLRIQECESMEQVFWNDDNINGCIEFPKLKYLILWNLPNLTTFCQGLENNIIKFPNLIYLDINVLPKLNSLFPPNSKDDNLRYLFPASMARSCLLRLEVLDIKYCESMEQVFWNEDRDDNTDAGCIEFPKLKKLRLDNLPNLTAFCQGLENIIIKFPNLTQMSIGGLPKLNSLSPLDSETVLCHDRNTCFHFVCNPKVEMGLLKGLILSRFEDNIKNIWCHQIPNNFFKNLERLHISFMNGIGSLMSTSIAKNLVSLKDLRISNCEEMVEVIEIDDDNDKQVVDINWLFPNLSELNLKSLPKLIRFWQWNHALELPLLEEIYISNCPAMETFTLGSINTPMKISINNKNIEDHKDLNDVIRHMWTKSQDTFKSEEKTHSRVKRKRR